jgi:hypothetical protein
LFRPRLFFFWFPGGIFRGLYPWFCLDRYNPGLDGFFYRSRRNRDLLFNHHYLAAFSLLGLGDSLFGLRDSFFALGMLNKFNLGFLHII